MSEARGCSSAMNSLRNGPSAFLGKFSDCRIYLRPAKEYTAVRAHFDTTKRASESGMRIRRNLLDRCFVCSW